MRRIYHRFPIRSDLVFTIQRPFIDVVSALCALHGTHDVGKAPGGEMVRIDFSAAVAEKKISFVPVDRVPDLLYTITEAVDFQIELKETTLMSDRRIPRSKNVFLLHIAEVGMASECVVVKTSTMNGLDAMDLKTLLEGVV
ncbi:hypothetical protein L0665_05620 [Methanogenium marinum]|uniref:Uncharacterized protein n=1 Tax=Methanogenium marinum TaxID=348610 RepID=A0A9Q4KSZ0_9EURY|nr:hypothetical protein [Methanogenium marinum]MDE4908086.1 hypothetical protein [Methanogenium marinum]